MRKESSPEPALGITDREAGDEAALQVRGFADIDGFEQAAPPPGPERGPSRPVQVLGECGRRGGGGKFSWLQSLEKPQNGKMPHPNQAIKTRRRGRRLCKSSAPPEIIFIDGPVPPPSPVHPRPVPGPETSMPRFAHAGRAWPDGRRDRMNPWSNSPSPLGPMPWQAPPIPPAAKRTTEFRIYRWNPGRRRQPAHRHFSLSIATTVGRWCSTR